MVVAPLADHERRATRLACRHASARGDNAHRRRHRAVGAACGSTCRVRCPSCSRVAPVGSASLVAGVVGGTGVSGPSALEPPVPLALAPWRSHRRLRLVFEENMLGYYFMALTVSLVLLDVTRGSIRRSVVRVAGRSRCGDVLSLRLSLRHRRMGCPPAGPALLPLAIGAGAVLAIVAGLRQGRGWKDLSPWVCVTLVVLCTQAPDANSFIGGGRVLWLWQLVLTVPALVFAAQPLRAALRDCAPGTGVPDSASTLHSAP